MKTIKEVEAYGRKCEKLLGLLEWRVKYVEQKEKHQDEETIGGQNRMRYAYRMCEIDVFPDFWEVSEEKQKHCLIHELVHCRTNFYQDFTESADVKYSLSGHARNLIINRLEDEEETSCELLARAFYNLIEGK